VCSHYRSRARESEDYTRDNHDDKDVVLIARLVVELRCYAPERADATWARLRHLGDRWAPLITKATAGRQHQRDLLECAWTTVYDGRGPAVSVHDVVCQAAVVPDRANGDPHRLARFGPAAV